MFGREQPLPVDLTFRADDADQPVGKSKNGPFAHLGNHKRGRNKVKDAWDPILEEKELFMVMSFGHCYIAN